MPGFGSCGNWCPCLRFCSENLCDWAAGAFKCCRPPAQHHGELPIIKDLVLVGGGHAHVHVLRMLGMDPMEGVRITLITRDLETPYSGMLPGHIAGHYTRNECHVDLMPLAQFAQARVIHASATGIDLDRRLVHLSGDRPPVAYDVLTIDIGSAPSTLPVSTGCAGESDANSADESKDGADHESTEDTNGDADGASKQLCFRDASVVAVKPIDGFGARWARICDRLSSRLRAPPVESAASSSTPVEFTYHVAVVGGGAGGTELVLAMQYRLHAMLAEHGWIAADDTTGSAVLASADPPTAASRPLRVARLRFSLLARSGEILPTHNPKVRRKFARIFAERGVELMLNSEVVEVLPPRGVSGDSAALGVEGNTGGTLRTVSGADVPFDECVWCTGGAAQAWLRKTGLPLDEYGFIQCEPTLQCLGAARSAKLACVFACGDVANVVQYPRPKAGVFAVRQGPPLLRNLRRVLVNARPMPFVPQRDFLSIVSTGDRYAVWSRGCYASEGASLWRIKDWIDRKWMRMYQELPQMGEPVVAPGAVARASGEDTLAVLRATPMRCGGCGSKVGSTVLSSVMRRLREQGMLPSRSEVLVGLDSPDDAAVVSGPTGGMATVHTVDFFRSFIDDPYVFGRIAANHALSDCHAMCAEAVSALAIVVVPFGLESKVEEQLFQVMAGACSALSESNCALVGGHTTEGPDLTLGFSINGVAKPEDVLAKGGMHVGDKIVLTKPVGTGVLFAAAMRSKARGPWIGSALKAMQESNLRPAAILREYGATCATDVTGFGLLGHLVEMVKASAAHVRLDLDTIPFLDGAEECVRAGVFSSLQGSNLRLRRAIENGADAAAASPHAYALAFDPQTAGGVLAAVPAEGAEACLAALRAAGCADAAVVGEVVRIYEDGTPSSGQCITCTFDGGSGLDEGAAAGAGAAGVAAVSREQVEHALTT